MLVDILFRPLDKKGFPVGKDNLWVENCFCRLGEKNCRLEKKLLVRLFFSVGWRKRFSGSETKNCWLKFLLPVGEKGFVSWKTNCQFEFIFLSVGESKIVGWKKTFCQLTFFFVRWRKFYLVGKKLYWLEFCFLSVGEKDSKVRKQILSFGVF